MATTQAGLSSPDWTSLEGAKLDNGYVLDECVSSDRRSASYISRNETEPEKHFIAKLYEADSQRADQQITLWESVQRVESPNLLRLFGTGRLSLKGFSLAYVITEAADERLSTALRERPLDARETGEMLTGVARALRDLHARGFTHGCLSPYEVFAVGESIKISRECARRIGTKPLVEAVEARYKAPESNGGNLTTAADVWCVGATVFEALTQRECKPGCAEHALTLPSPFSEIVRHCLDAEPGKRCTLAEIEAMHARKQPLTHDHAMARVRPRQTTVPAHRERKQWVPIAVLIAVLIVVAAISFAWRRHAGPGSGVTDTASHPAAAAPRPATQERPRATATKPLASPKLAEAAPRETAVGAEDHAATAGTGRYSKTINGPIWRVVVYTYDRRPDAENRARSLNQKYPNFRAEVFSPSGDAGPYLVVIGGAMDRDQASALRTRAIASGLPRDTYMQNYNH